MEPSTAPSPPPPFRFTTEHFSEWQQFWTQGEVMSVRPERTVNGPFRAGFAFLGGTPNLGVTRSWGTPHKMIRDGSAEPETHYFLGLTIHGRLITTFKGKEPQIWNRQVLSFGTPSLPFEQVIEPGADGTSEVSLLRIARPLVDTLVRRLPGPALMIPTTGPGALVAAYIRHLTPHMGGLDPHALALFEQQLGALLAMAIDIHPDAQEIGRSAMRQAQLDRVLAYLDRRHTDPALTPEGVARTLGISVRYLHRLFEAHQGTFSQALLQRRLATAHRLLSSPMSKGKTVLELAFTAGFNSANAFYRAFRAAYGMTPKDARPMGGAA
jgi:AraC-like DNA-binding protein